MPGRRVEPQRDPLLYDRDWNEDERIDEWQTVLQETEGLPPVLRAILALDAWNSLEVLQHAPWLGRLLAAAMEYRGSDSKLSPNVPDDDLVNALAQYLALEPIERQALLECDGVLSRCGALIELLEMRSMMAPGTGSWTSGLAH